MLDVTVVIPTIYSRSAMLEQAVQSVLEQELQAADVIIEHDIHRQGPAVVRNRALARVQTPWLAWLDDDDLLMPQHLRVLADVALSADADLVWPWFTVSGGGDPFPMHFGRQWDPEHPHQFPITYLVRTELVRRVGGFETVPDGPAHADGNRAGEDWRLQLAMSAAGGRFVHLPERTWIWRHHGGNTSGLPERVR